MKSIVAIVGRPNVGKSTLFNRLTESREAIIDPVEGVTRDRKYGDVHWAGKEFTVIDTGGYINESEDGFHQVIRNQVEISIQEADIIFFMVDGLAGMMHDDEMIGQLLRRSKKPVFTICNKVDTAQKEELLFPFYALGLGDKVYPLSAANGYSTGDLLDDVVKNIPEIPEEVESDRPKIAVVGRPNVGKSSLLNNLLGETRAIVTDIAGTTRDAIEHTYQAFGFDLDLIDTAGLRKKKAIEDNLEFYSTLRTMRAINKSDVCILVLDAQNGIEKQDLTIFQSIIDAKKGVVIFVNKWDLIEKDNTTTNEFSRKIKERLAPFTDVPIIYTSNITKQRIHKGLEEALNVFENRKQRIPTSKLNEFFLPIIEHNPPPATKGKYIRIKYVTQLPTKTPVFAFFCNLPQYIKDPYKRYLENQIRQHFDFKGVALNLWFRKK